MNLARKLKVLHVEDDENDAALVREALQRGGIDCDITLVNSAERYEQALVQSGYDLILSDSNVPGFARKSSLKIAAENAPRIPFVYVSGTPAKTDRMEKLLAEGASGFVSKSELRRLPGLLEALPDPAPATPVPPPAHSPPAKPVKHGDAYLRGVDRLVRAVQELSRAKNIESIRAIVRTAAREIVGSDGATFVLRTGDKCHYVDEDAIAPLWKGSRFPMSACISGWVMIHREHAVIEDIYTDPRIPADAYRPTFVKSLVMVPIRKQDPVGAIGNYWARPHKATDDEIAILQALADSTAVAMESVSLGDRFEECLRDRTHTLETENDELLSFSHAVSHDLTAPLRHIEGFSEMLLEDSGERLDPQGLDYLHRITRSVSRMTQLTDDLLRLSRISQTQLAKAPADLAVMAREILATLREQRPERRVEILIPDTLPVVCDPGLTRIVMENLLSNAWKYSSKKETARIECGALSQPDGRRVYFVRDNGAGFDPGLAPTLFNTFTRLHTEEEFPGTGVGLATVRRIIRKHGGLIRADAKPGEGAVFYFTLGEAA